MKSKWIIPKSKKCDPCRDITSCGNDSNCYDLGFDDGAKAQAKQIAKRLGTKYDRPYTYIPKGEKEMKWQETVLTDEEILKRIQDYFEIGIVPGSKAPKIALEIAKAQAEKSFKAGYEAHNNIIGSIVKEYFPDATPEFIKNAIWSHTGYSSFWMISTDDNTPEECFRKQLQSYKQAIMDNLYRNTELET